MQQHNKHATTQHACDNMQACDNKHATQHNKHATTQQACDNMHACNNKTSMRQQNKHPTTCMRQHSQKTRGKKRKHAQTATEHDKKKLALLE
jgi:hypothetical protein